nr:response regulator [Acanthopleuribacter pedis]
MFLVSGLLVADSGQAAQQKRILEGVKFEHLTTRDGLSQNGVFTIVQDHHGFLWFGTRDGLSRFDGQRFRTYYRDFQDETTLLDNSVSHLAVGGDGVIWALNYVAGISRFDPETGTFQRFPLGAPEAPQCQHLNGVSAGPGNTLFVSHDRGLAQYNPETGRFDEIDLSALAEGDVESAEMIWFPGDDALWIATNQGLLRYHPEQGILKVYAFDDTDPNRLPPRFFTAIQPSGQGKLWLRSSAGIGLFDPETEHYEPVDFGSASWPGEGGGMLRDSRGILWIPTKGGVMLYDPQFETLTQLRAEAKDPRTLSEDHVVTVFEDRSNMVWLGTFGGGVNLYNRSSETIGHVRLDFEGVNNYKYAVFAFVEGDDGLMHVATESAGVLTYDPGIGSVVPAQEASNDPDAVHPDILDMLPADGGMWLGTVTGLKWFDPKQPRWRDVADPEGAAYNQLQRSIQDLEYGPHGEIFMASFGGLIAYQPRDGSWRFWVHDPENPESLPHNFLLAAHQTERALYLGTYGNGLFEFDGVSRFRQFPADGADPDALSHATILTIIEGPDGRLWIGTLGGGLNVFDPETERFKRYTRKHGLVNEKVFGLAFDGDGDLWIATNRGLSRLNLQTEQFRNFGLSHNLQANEFGRGAILRARDGTMYFGGVNGFNFLQPRALRTQAFHPPIVLSDVEVLNLPVQFDRETADLQEVTFAHDDRAIQFHFAALDFRSPRGLRYAYRVPGLTPDWVPLGNKGDVSFPKLAPGRYTLEMKVANADGEWVPETRKLAITVTPPWWANPYAYALYLFSGLMAVGFYLRRQQAKLQRSEAMNQRLMRVDELKDEFLANTSHELRTPIHGLVGLAESLLAGDAGEVSPAVADNLQLMVLSGKRLDNLVNDILDFSKLKQAELVLNLQPVDPAMVIEAVLAVCQPLAADKKVTLINDVSESLPFVNADEGRLQQVLFNLVGNAIKFSEEGEVRLVGERHDNLLRIAVHDQGIGFDPSMAEKIFESFQQGDGSATREYGGTGLGLAISRQLIERMAGRIWAEGYPGRGAVFTFELPISGEKTLTVYRTGVDGRVAESTLEVKNPIAAVVPGSFPAVASAAGPPREYAVGLPDGRAIRILAVDDEVANRRILANFLQVHRYEVVLAANGIEALEALKTDSFDLVLLDVMMPRMSGFEVCKRIRETHSLQELPIIFLTAKNQNADIVTAFQLGANDYLSKPFSRDSLLSRVKPHLELLDINRNLEQKVLERTQALQAYTHELETLNRIVQTINREMSAEGLLPTLLEQAMALFQSVSCGTFLLRDTRDQKFRVTVENACTAYLKARDYSEAAVRKQFLADQYQLDDATYFLPLTDSSGVVAGWFLMIALVFEGRLEGVMLLQTQTNPSEVAKTEFTRLHRFREHAVVAVGRVKTLNELVDKQRERVATAHLVGMAENASSVLHNMGNSLNSINISSEVIEHKLAQSNWPSLAERLLARFKGMLGSGEEGAQLTETLSKLLIRIEHRDAAMLEELRRLRQYLNQSLDVLRDQHALSGVTENPEPVEINPLLQACAQAVEIAGLPIDFTLRQGSVPILYVPKIKFMLMIAGLMRYLAFLSVENGAQVHPCYVESEQGTGHVVVRLRCSGGGLSAQRQQSLFDQNQSGELHNSANLAKEIGGGIEVESEGPGRGVTLLVRLPANIHRETPLQVAG